MSLLVARERECIKLLFQCSDNKGVLERLIAFRVMLKWMISNNNLNPRSAQLAMHLSQRKLKHFRTFLSDGGRLQLESRGDRDGTPHADDRDVGDTASSAELSSESDDDAPGPGDAC